MVFRWQADSGSLYDVYRVQPRAIYNIRYFCNFAVSYFRHFTLVGHQKFVELNMMSAAAHSTKYNPLSVDEVLKSAFCKMHFPCIIKNFTQRFKIDLSSKA